jgi:hypothetical protein
MTNKLDKEALMTLKIAFSYMPKAIEVTKYEYGDHRGIVNKGYFPIIALFILSTIQS